MKEVMSVDASRTAAESGYYARIIKDLRETALTTEEIAGIVEVQERAVYNWASGTHRPKADARDRLLEVAYIVEQLKEIYTPEGVDIWIHARNRSLGHERPIDLLRSGHFAPVLNAIERLNVGAM